MLLIFAILSFCLTFVGAENSRGRSPSRVASSDEMTVVDAPVSSKKRPRMSLMEATTTNCPALLVSMGTAEAPPESCRTGRNGSTAPCARDVCSGRGTGKLSQVPEQDTAVSDTLIRRSAVLICLTRRVRHDEERASGGRLEQQRDPAPRHCLHPLVRNPHLFNLFLSKLSSITLPSPRTKRASRPGN